MPQTVDPMFAQEVLEWWIEHADEALKDGRSGRREHEFCRSGTKPRSTDEPSAGGVGLIGVG